MSDTSQTNANGFGGYRQRLRGWIRKLRRKHPVFDYWVFRLSRGYLKNTVKNRVRGEKNVIDAKRALLRNVVFDIEGNANTIEIGRHAIINALTVRIRGDHHLIRIGEHCLFNLGGEIWFEDHSCRLVIGESTSFENVHLAVTEPRSSITVGKDCMFARDVVIRTGDSHSLLDENSGTRLNMAADVVIGDHVWIGERSIVLKGVRIAANTVVAAGAIVTRSFAEPGVVVAGNPAKVVKRRINWCRKRYYSEA